MARRKRRRRGVRTPVVLLGAMGALVLLETVRRFVADHLVEATIAAVVLLAIAATTAVLILHRAAARRRRQAELDRNIAGTDGMTGPEFEQYVARLMRGSGFRRVRVSGGAGDLGADVVGYTPDGRKVVVQCKRYTGSVGDPHIQKFNGTARHIHDADVPLFVTTGRPTARARELAARCAIVLVDRQMLAGWATTGVPPVPGMRRQVANGLPYPAAGLRAAPDAP